MRINRKQETIIICSVLSVAGGITGGVSHKIYSNWDKLQKHDKFVKSQQSETRKAK